MPQCAVIGCPGQYGHCSLAALPQTVNTKSSFGAPGGENSFQLLLRSPSVGRWVRSRASSVTGWTSPLGLLPALKARKRPRPQ